MKYNTISLRRRHLVIAGLAGIAAPATLFAGPSGGTPGDAPAVAEYLPSGSSGEGQLVVSGRILGAPHGKPLAGAVVEAWHAPGSVRCASVITDADGRFMFTTLASAEAAGHPPHIHYRVSHHGHETPLARLHFARESGISDDRVAHLQRDNAGTWRASFGVTLA